MIVPMHVQINNDHLKICDFVDQSLSQAKTSIRQIIATQLIFLSNFKPFTFNICRVINAVKIVLN